MTTPRSGDDPQFGTVDIFTLEPLVSPASPEHIVPSALGGRWSSTRIINRETNRRIGNLDDSLGSAFGFVRSALEMKTRRGRPAPPIDLEAGDVRLVHGLRPQAVTKHPSALIDGVATLVTPNEEEASKLVPHLLARFGISIPEVTQTHSRTLFDEKVRFRVCLGAEQLRAVAKIGFEAFALFSNSVPPANFDEARRWILNGTGDACCDLHEDNSVWDGLPRLADAPFQHRVFVLGGTDRVAPYALVEIFGALRFSVALGPTSSTELVPIDKGYLVDPVSGRDERDIKISNPGPIPERSINDNDLLGTMVGTLQGQLQRLLHCRFVKERTKELQRARVEDGSHRISSQDIEALAQAICGSLPLEFIAAEGQLVTAWIMETLGEPAN